MSLVERICAVDAGEHGNVLDDGQNLAAHLDHEVVGVAVGEQSGEGASARHAESTGVVDDDEVGAAFFLTFGGEPRSGARSDDRPALGDLVGEAREDL
jgi:hypothetical protein